MAIEAATVVLFRLPERSFGQLIELTSPIILSTNGYLVGS